jgi:hypothetical protein
LCIGYLHLEKIYIHILETYAIFGGICTLERCFGPNLTCGPWVVTLLTRFDMAGKRGNKGQKIMLNKKIKLWPMKYISTKQKILFSFEKVLVKSLC